VCVCVCWGGGGCLRVFMKTNALPGRRCQGLLQFIVALLETGKEGSTACGQTSTRNNIEANKQEGRSERACALMGNIKSLKHGHGACAHREKDLVGLQQPPATI
jgi:hypothetical protein